MSALKVRYCNSTSSTGYTHLPHMTSRELAGAPNQPVAQRPGPKTPFGVFDHEIIMRQSMRQLHPLSSRWRSPHLLVLGTVFCNLDLLLMQCELCNCKAESYLNFAMLSLLMFLEHQRSKSKVLGSFCILLLHIIDRQLPRSSYCAHIHNYNRLHLYDLSSSSSSSYGHWQYKRS
jgi:hypothetical protein